MLSAPTFVQIAIMLRSCTPRRFPRLSTGLAFTACLALLGASGIAGQEIPTPRVDGDWLAGELGAPDLVLLHVGGDREDYEAGHLPGARFFNLGDVVYSVGRGDDPDRIAVDLPEDLDQVRAAFAAAGVSDDSRVVVYLAADRPVYLVTRALWTLEFMGMGDRAALLDGGYAAWVAEGRPVETGGDQGGMGTLTASPDWSRIVTREWLVEHLDADDMALIDARMTPSYTGEREEIPGRAGHIPGAGSLPIEDLFMEDGTLRPAGELRDLFARAGVEDGDTVVAYCHVGLRASTVVFAARAAGFNALLYDGSMTEWARARDLPLVSGTSPR